jgi:TonB-linked SusC/RagA family outer membrane protein
MLAIAIANLKSSSLKPLAMDRNVTAVRRCYNFVFSFLFLLLSAPALFAQQTIRGRVTDSTSNTGLPRITVSVKGTNRATATDGAGNFTINAARGEVLQFSAVGFLAHEVTVSDNTTITVPLQSRNSSLNEVVVIGYGTRQRKDVTGAVSTVGVKEIEKSTALTPELALQGRTPGVFVSSGGGAPGSRPTVRIRGVNTFGYSEPLYVIDGVPFFEGGSGVTDGGIGDIRSPVNALSLINPADIESITVLKDASSAAIYGVRASNGVILITTKRGKAGRPRVEVSTLYGVQNIPKTVNTLNTQQYFELLREAYANNPEPNTTGGLKTFAERFGPRYDQGNPLYQGNAPTYNWQNELQDKNAILSDHTVRLSGGSENTTYYMSAGYSFQESPLKANNVKRYSIATNIDSRVSKYISTGVTLRLIQQNSYENTGADLGSMISTIPFQPIYDPNNPFGFAEVARVKFKPNGAYDPNMLNTDPPFLLDGDPELIWGPNTRFNPFAWQKMNSNKYDLNRIMGNAYIQIEPLKGLRIKGTLGGDYYTNLRMSFQDFESYRFSQTPGNPYANTNGKSQGTYGERTGKTTNLNKELTVNFNRTIFGDHNFDILLGASHQFTNWSWTDVSNPNLPYRNPRFRSIANERGLVSGAQGRLQEEALLGYVARVSYKYRDKYYVDGTMRRDGSGRLAPGKKWDNFPSFAVAWRISSERFFPKTNFINDLKLRGGWGRLGNYQSAGAYQYLSGVSLSPDYALGSGNGNATGTQLQGASLPQFANETLTWEKLRTSNFGFDASLFNNRVTFTAEYYDKTTFDIIQNVVPPPNTGIQSSVSLNVATVKNKGFEFNLGYNNRVGPVNFNVNGNLTTVNNKVLDLNLDNPFGGNYGRVEEGYSMFYLWGWKMGGIFQNQAEIDAWRKAHADELIGQNIRNPSAGNQYKPGDAYFVDVYGNPRTGTKERFSPAPDSLINNNDRTYLGKTIPGFYYGLNFDANYAGFDISLFFQGVGDVQKYNDLRVGGESSGSIGNQWTTALERWTPSNPSSTIPRAVWNNPTNPDRFSSRFVEDAGYLRLKVLEVGYRLQGGLLGKIGFLQNLRVFGRGINMFTVTKWKGIDPENDYIPPTRQFLFGVNAGF